MVSYWHPNTRILPGHRFSRIQEPSAKSSRGRNARSLKLLADAINRAKSTDPLRVAYAMEGRRPQTLTGAIECSHPITNAAALWVYRTKVGGANTRLEKPLHMENRVAIDLLASQRPVHDEAAAQP